MGAKSSRSKKSDEITALPPKAGDHVFTQYGPGTVQSYNAKEGHFVIKMDWTLAEGASVISYLQPSCISLKEEEKKPKRNSVFNRLMTPKLRPTTTVDSLLTNPIPVESKVSTPYGPGFVSSYNTTAGHYVIRLDWLLADGERPTAYMQPECVTRFQAGKVGDAVTTAYGTGTVVEIRKADNTHIVKMAQLQGTATAYLQPETIQGGISAVVGSTVQTAYGKGVVTIYRHSDHTYIVRLPFGEAYLQADTILKTNASSSGCTIQ